MACASIPPIFQYGRKEWERKGKERKGGGEETERKGRCMRVASNPFLSRTCVYQREKEGVRYSNGMKSEGGKSRAG